MKFIKWKILITTSVVCLLPILLGVVLWDELPETMAIHFDINNTPDNFATKEFGVFGLPVLMAVLQAFCCFISDINAKKHGERIRFELATKWIIPIMCVILQTVMLGYALGWNLDIRKIAVAIVGVIFLVIGNYMPKLDYIKNHDIDTQKARKINRFLGFETVIMGLLFLISIFLPPIASSCCLVMLIPYSVIGIIYAVKAGKRG